MKVQTETRPANERDKKLKYFCERCKSLKFSFIVLITPEGETKNKEFEVIKLYFTPDNQEKRARKLTCNHYISIETQGFSDSDLESEVLAQHEIAEIREKLNKSMIGKTSEEVGQTILFHVEQYQTLLKIASKQKQQAQYALQCVEQMKEKFADQLKTEEAKQNFHVKFYQSLNLKPSTAKFVERENKERKAELTAAEKQKQALDKVRALLSKSGISKADLGL